MSEMDLFNILGDLKSNDFKNFTWYLKKEKVGDIPPIQECELSKEERRDVVDLMVGKYEVAGAVQVTTSILKKINRNDLASKLAKIASGAEGVGPGETPGRPAEDSVPADERLRSIRTEFINRVSEPVLMQLLDQLLDRAITDQEMQAVETKASKADKARYVIDTVRVKGPAASSVLIAALCKVDPCLSRKLNLS